MWNAADRGWQNGRMSPDPLYPPVEPMLAETRESIPGAGELVDQAQHHARLGHLNLSYSTWEQL